MNNGFKRSQKLLPLMFLVMMITSANAQLNLAFYSFENQFNSSNYNPAFLSSGEKFTFSIFPIGGTSIGYNSQAIIRDLLTKFLSGESPDDDYYRKVLENMADKPMFNQNIETGLLNFTYDSKLGFFNFRIKENESFTASVTGDLTKFILKEGSQSVVIGQNQALSAQAIHYREYSLGYSYKSALNKFSAGFRAKLYFGKAALFSSLLGSILNESGKYVLKTTGELNMSFPELTNSSGSATIDLSKIGGSKLANYLLNSGNPGLGVDLGINYRFTPRFSFSMSVIDLGKIKWSSNVTSRYFKPYTLPDSSYITPNSGKGEIIKLNGFKYAKYLPEYIRDTIYNPSSFSMPLPINVFAGIKYRLKPNLTISLTDRYVSLKNLSFNSFSATANIDVNKALSISTGYSIIGNSYFNLPFAVLFKRDFGQIYFGSDNLAAFILPSFSDYASLSFGTCFYLFKNLEFNKLTSNEHPFYKSRKIKKSRKSGLIKKAYPES